MNTSSSTIIGIPDFQTGVSVIARAPLANPPEAIRDFDRILDSLLAAPPDHETFFRLLEHLRPPAVSAAEELSKRFVDKPVPLGDIEAGFFKLVARFWLKIAKAYKHCAEMDVSAADTRPERLAALLHRCIHFTGLAIREHHRARQEVPWGLWLDLHGYYGTAEDLRLAFLPIPTIVEAHGGKTHCTAAYLAFILCDMADSYSLTLREQTLVWRWASAWSAMIGLHPVTAGESLPMFVIDLMQDVALRPSAECLRTDQIRRLDISRLASYIDDVRKKLRQRVTPLQLGLGDDCTPQQCGKLLTHLARQWSHVRTARKFRRRATSGIVAICTGFEEMHYFISGKAFQQPESARAYSRGVFEDTYSLRFQDDPQQAMQIRPSTPAVTYAVDDWEMIDQSANGFRLMRSVSGRKMVHGQLLALRPNDAEQFMLAQSTWLMQESRGGLIAGIRVLPGLPTAICARPPIPPGGPRVPYQRAFLLPGLPAAEVEQSVVLPAGIFALDKILDVYTDRAWRVRLKTVLDSGADFERVSFELC